MDELESESKRILVTKQLVEGVAFGAGRSGCVADGEQELARPVAFGVLGGDGELVIPWPGVTRDGVLIGVARDEVGEVEDSVGAASEGKGAAQVETQQLRV